MVRRALHWGRTLLLHFIAFTVFHVRRVTSLLETLTPNAIQDRSLLYEAYNVLQTNYLFIEEVNFTEEVKLN